MDNQLINLINDGVLTVLDGGIARASLYLPVNNDKTTINTVIVVTPGYWVAKNKSIINDINTIQMEFYNNCKHTYENDGSSWKVHQLKLEDIE